MNSILIRHSYLPVRQCWLTGGKRFLSAANRRVFAGIGTDSRLRFFSSKVDNGRPVNRGRITALQDTTCALDQSKLAVESNAGGDTPLPLSIEMQNFIRDLQNAFVAGDERIISRLMAVANSDPAVASTVGFQHLLDACISQFCSPRGTCDNRHIENRFIKHSVPWLLQMSYSTRLKYIEEIMHLAKSCDKIFFPRFAAAFFIALSEKKLVQLAAVDKLNLTSDVSLPGDAVLSTLRRMLLAPNKKPAIMFLITMFRRGVISLLNTSTEGISGAVLFTVAEREAGRLRPSQVDLLLNPLFSMMKGNRRIQNGCQNAVAHALKSNGHYLDLIYFVDVLTQFSDTHLSHSVLSRLADAYFSQGDSARGFAAFDCLRAGLLLDAGVVRYIDSAADSDSNVLEVDLGACELADSVATLQSTEFDILRKKRFIRRAPFVRCNDYYCAFLAFRDGQAGQDIGRCREHLVQLLRRMRADKLSPDVQMLKRIMVENLHVDVSLEATLLYHDWLLAILRSLANRKYDYNSQQPIIEELVSMHLRCFLKRVPQLQKEFNELLEFILHINLQLNSESVWYLMRCLNRHRDHFPVISTYKEMTAKFQAPKQQRHALVVAESLIELDEYEKAELVIDSLMSREVTLPPYLLQKYPVLIFMRLRRRVDLSGRPIARRAVAYATKMISGVPLLLPTTERNLYVLKDESPSWIWQEICHNMGDILKGPSSQLPAGKLWMAKLLKAQGGLNVEGKSYSLFKAISGMDHQHA